MSDEDLFAPWRDDAPCASLPEQNEILIGAWDGPNEDGDQSPFTDYAVSVCVSQCKVRIECLASALRNPEAQGIRGGYIFDGGTVPVAKAREIRDTLGLKLPPWQSAGRAKQ